VLAFADHEDVGIVDTNIARVIARIENRSFAKKELQLVADALVPEGLSWEWNQVLMDFGATVCTARAPKCDGCVVNNLCMWNVDGGNDPAPATAGTSKPQARFEGSDRQARGKLMKALVSGTVQCSDAARVMNLRDQEERAKRIVQSLLNDRLIVMVNDYYQSPS
jgi:A/G-specific adenine glycosylase